MQADRVGVVRAPRSRAEIAKLKDTTDQPLQPPSILSNVRFLQTSAIPVNLASGGGSTADRTTEMFAGDYSQFLVGMRLNPTIQVLKER